MTPPRLSIADMFASYRAGVIPDDAPAIQVDECRRAFYAGSYALLMAVANTIGDDAIGENEGVEILESLQAECEAFATADAAETAPPAAPPVVVDA
jgi:hypothetical protein